MRQRCREATASDSSSSKANHLEGYFTTVQMEPVTVLCSAAHLASVILLLQQRRGAAAKGLGTTIKYLRRTVSGAAANGLGTTIK
jgi:hypothetical protein